MAHQQSSAIGVAAQRRIRSRRTAAPASKSMALPCFDGGRSACERHGDGRDRPRRTVRPIVFQCVNCKGERGGKGRTANLLGVFLSLLLVTGCGSKMAPEDAEF